MLAIGRMAAELLGVLLAGVVLFFVVIGYAFGILFMWACGIVSGLFLIVALFSGVMWLFTHSPQCIPHHARLSRLCHRALRADCGDDLLSREADGRAEGQTRPASTERQRQLATARAHPRASGLGAFGLANAIAPGMENEWQEVISSE
jgi:hypothetical protein